MTTKQARQCFLYGIGVHFDTDNREWGRVASDGKIIEVQGRYCLVNAYSIRATIRVRTSELHDNGNETYSMKP